MKNCDALLILGTDFPTAILAARRPCRRSTSAGNSRAADPVDQASSGRQGDRAAAAAAARAARDDEHLRLTRALPQRPRESSTRSPATQAGRPIHPQFVARAGRRWPPATRSSLPTWHAGGVGGALPHMNGHRRLLGSFVHGSMANALRTPLAPRPATGRQVVSLSGDGGLAMLLGELITLRQQRPPGQGRHLQQRRARLRRARDEGGRAPRFRARTFTIPISPGRPRHRPAPRPDRAPRANEDGPSRRPCPHDGPPSSTSSTARPRALHPPPHHPARRPRRPHALGTQRPLRPRRPASSRLAKTPTSPAQVK